MKRTIILVILVLIFVVTGCQKEDAMDKKEIEKRAENVAVEYMKVEENTDFVVTGYEFTDSSVHLVSVNGHVKDKKDKKMSVVIDYDNDFEVQTIGED